MKSHTNNLTRELSADEDRKTAKCETRIRMPTQMQMQADGLKHTHKHTVHRDMCIVCTHTFGKSEANKRIQQHFI